MTLDPSTAGWFGGYDPYKFNAISQGALNPMAQMRSERAYLQVGPFSKDQMHALGAYGPEPLLKDAEAAKKFDDWLKTYAKRLKQYFHGLDDMNFLLLAEFANVSTGKRGGLMRYIERELEEGDKGMFKYEKGGTRSMRWRIIKAIHEFTRETTDGDTQHENARHFVMAWAFKRLGLYPEGEKPTKEVRQRGLDSCMMTLRNALGVPQEFWEQLIQFYYLYSVTLNKIARTAFPAEFGAIADPYMMKRLRPKLSEKGRRCLVGNPNKGSGEPAFESSCFKPGMVEEGSDKMMYVSTSDGRWQKLDRVTSEALRGKIPRAGERQAAFENVLSGDKSAFRQMQSALQNATQIMGASPSSRPF